MADGKYLGISSEHVNGALNRVMDLYLETSLSREEIEMLDTIEEVEKSIAQSLTVTPRVKIRGISQVDIGENRTILEDHLIVKLRRTRTGTDH